MSWKLAELKWRQELGLYQSRRERDSGSLPLERKQAIHAFESRGRAPRARDEFGSARKRWKTSPERHHARLGTPVPPVSPSPAVTAPVTHSSPTFPRAYPSNHSLFDSSLLSGTAIDAGAAKAKALSRDVGHPTRRSRSCSALTGSYPPLSQDRRSPRCTSPFRTKKGQDSSSWLPTLPTHTPHSPEPCEELTRLLDHLDSVSSSDSETDHHSPLSTLDFLQFTSSHGQERGFRSPPGPFQSSEIDFREDLLDLGVRNFALLGNPLSGSINDIVTATDSSETCWPTTVSKHNSSSTLLPRTNMPGWVNRADGDDDSPPASDDESPEVTMPVGGQVQRPPIRRTTPIYQHLDQAYASITGSANGFRFPSSTAGTDSLNDVYTRAMQEEPLPSRETSVMPTAGAVSPSNSGPVQLPFQRTLSPDNEDHMNVPDGNDNPAGLPINADDVALVPILRNGPRSSVVLLSSPTGASPSVAFVEDNNGLRERSSSFLTRPRTPVPFPAPADSEIDSTVGALVDEYGDNDEETDRANPAERGSQNSSSSSDEQNIIEGPHIGRVFAQPHQHHADPTAGLPPSWPLPEEPSTLPAGVGANLGHLSSSPPTYGTTAGLLNEDRGSVTALRQGVLHHPIPAALRTSSLYSSEVDEAIARRGRSTTPFNQIGDPGPAVSSSPRLLLPQPSAVEGFPSRLGQTQVFERTDEPSSSSGIGIAVTSADDPVVAFSNGNDIAEVIETDDAAWETTQGSNTQRNSAVPDVELAFPSSSSSLGDRATSGWDPLSAVRRAQFDEVEREFAGLVQAQRMNDLGGIATSTPEHSAEIASPQEPEQARPPTFIASPDSGQPITQTHIPQTHNNTQQSSRSAAGCTPFVRTPLAQMAMPQNIVEMTSDADNDEEATFAAERAARLAAIEAEIRRYEPRPDDVGPLREYPNARLTTDRRVLEAENDPAFVRRQHRLSRLLLCLFTAFYHLGGFVFVNSMANNGPMARYALLVASLFGGEPINNIHHEDMAVAERVENWLAGLVGVVVAALSGVLIAFLCGALE